MTAPQEHREREQLDDMRRGLVRTERERVFAQERRDHVWRVRRTAKLRAMDGAQASFGEEMRAPLAIDVLEERRRVALGLERAGARVVDAPAAALGEACVRAYLRLKARARL